MRCMSYIGPATYIADLQHRKRQIKILLIAWRLRYDVKCFCCLNHVLYSIYLPDVEFFCRKSRAVASIWMVLLRSCVSLHSERRPATKPQKCGGVLKLRLVSKTYF